MFYTDYWKVENWEVLETKEFHFFNDDETPFSAVCVKIGTLTTYRMDATGYKSETTPISRWISLGEYNKIVKNSGVVIF